MTTLKPPFRAEDMEGLYKKVIRGYYPRIPGHFSQDLSNIIRALLQVTPHLRPSCEKILQYPAVLKRIEDRHLLEVDEGIPTLLNTIRFPKNLHYLTDRLPAPNYNPMKVKKIDKIKYMQTMGAKINIGEEDSFFNENSFTKKNNGNPDLPKIMQKKKNERGREVVSPGSLLNDNESSLLPNINVDSSSKPKLKSAKKQQLQKSPIPIKEYKDYIQPQNDLKSNDDKISRILAGHKQEIRKLVEIPRVNK